MSIAEQFLTLAAYARRIGVIESTVRRWRLEGMPVAFDFGDVGVRLHVPTADAWVYEHHRDSVAIFRTSLVYVVQRASGPVKVGFSTDVERRLRELATECGGEGRHTADCESCPQLLSERVTARIDPSEPKCCCDEHDWQRPHAIVGGLESNPGVRGHGGGVIITEVCTHCGCARVTDTWGQNRATGEQGLEVISYDRHQYAREIEAWREQAIADTADECTRWHLEQGWEGSGDDYDIGPMVGDREALEERLERPATRDELRDLESAIQSRLTEAQEDAA